MRRLVKSAVEEAGIGSLNIYETKQTIAEMGISSRFRRKSTEREQKRALKCQLPNG